MRKNTIPFILLALFVPFLLVLILYLLFGKVPQNNGFTRKIKPLPLKLLTHIENKPYATEICGISNGNLYLGTKNPGSLLVLDTQLQQKTLFSFSLPKNKEIASVFATFIDSPNVFLTANNLPGTFHHNLRTQTTTKYLFPNSVFTRSVYIGNNNFVFRGFSNGAPPSEQVFYKYNFSKDIITIENQISEFTGDGGMLTDGLLNFDTLTNTLTYSFFYRNGFLCMDTNLQLINKVKTIDTFYSSQIEADFVKMKSGLINTNVRPKRIVNRLSFAKGGRLYINSGLRSENENRDDFKLNSVIDVYDIKSGLYLYSFYLPKLNGESINRFYIENNFAIVIYNTTIAKFGL